MKGLLFKDYCEGRKTIWMLLAFALIFAVTQGESWMFFTAFLSVSLSINLMTVDENTRFDRLLMTMPVSGVRLVLDKYIVAWVMLLLPIAAGVVAQRLPWFSFGEPMPLWLLCLIMAIELLMLTIVLTVLYRFGMERGRVLYIVVIGVMGGVIGVASGALAGSGFDFGSFSFAAAEIIGPVALLLSLALNIGSMFLSARFFERRLTA